MKQPFREEIDSLLAGVPADVCADPNLRGVHYDYQPWFPLSALSFQSAGEDSDDPAAWRYFQVAQSDCARLTDVIQEYGDDRLTYHRQLVKAAEALLDTDTARAALPPFVRTDGFPNRLFLPMVDDADKTFEFNYCEYVVASRLAQRG